jgi:hypothetical protein
MHQLISSFGLQFSVFELQGTLTYEHTRSGRPAKRYEISETDIEDVSDNEASDAGALTAVRAGIDASAAGIQVRLIKNDGHLLMKFEGRDGSTSEWTFDGMDTQRMASSISTQTLIDPDKCATCGHEIPAKSEMRESDTQTDVVAVQQVTFSAEAASQTAIKTEETTNPTAKSTNDSSSQTTDSLLETARDVKRKPSPILHVDEPIHKRAKSTHNSKPSPPVIYMECKRHYPTSKADTGKLIIDIEKGTVRYEEIYGKHHAQTIETKQVDIKSPSSKVTYTALHSTASGATHQLTISRLTKAAETMEVADFHCAAPKWKTWYNDPHVGRYYINGAEVVVDAIVHCIDRTSEREPVHDPRRDLIMKDEQDPDMRALLHTEVREEAQQYRP